MGIVGGSLEPGSTEDDLLKVDSRDQSRENDEDEDDDEEPDLETSDETDDLTKPEKAEKRKKRLRLKNLRRKTKARAYELTGANDCVGIVFMEIGRITDLPPERNGIAKNPVLHSDQALTASSDKNIL